MTFAIAVLLILGTLLYVLGIRRKDLPPPIPISPTQHLEERKAAIYENLRDLQFEYRVGKLSDEDYQRTKAGLQKELAGVLGEIDRIRKEKPEAIAAAAAAPAVGKRLRGSICPHCGAEFDKIMKFCGECGKAIEG
ncbi:MAG: zinc ribbon domain-containing protein [Bryobacteraceae bacterium]|nr:zinc ribbon domain-containing protein [Bryobacteraceae bacterium]